MGGAEGVCFVLFFSGRAEKVTGAYWGLIGSEAGRTGGVFCATPGNRACQSDRLGGREEPVGCLLQTGWDTPL